MLINRTNIADMFRGFNVRFQEAWDQAPSQYLQVATEIASSTSEEKMAWLGTMPRFREWVGDRVLNSLKTHDYTIKNKDFEATIVIDRNSIEDDSYKVYTPAVQMLGNEAKTHPDELVFQQAVLGGFSNRCYDGQYFFDNSHPVIAPDGSMTTFSNNGGGSSTPWYLLDVSRPIKPFIFQKRRDYTPISMVDASDEAVFMRKEFRYGVDARVNVGYGLWQQAFASRQTLDLTAYKAARAQMMSIKGDNGKVLNMRPGLILVPPSLEGAALDIVKATRLASGADNVFMGTAVAMVCPWLA